MLLCFDFAAAVTFAYLLNHFHNILSVYIGDVALFKFNLYFVEIHIHSVLLPLSFVDRCGNGLTVVYSLKIL